MRTVRKFVRGKPQASAVCGGKGWLVARANSWKSIVFLQFFAKSEDVVLRRGKEFALNTVLHTSCGGSSVSGLCNGMNLPKAETFDTAITWFNVAVRHSFSRVCLWAAKEFKEGRFHYIRSRAENGDAGYEYQLGLMYEQGEHGLRSDYEAHKWFLRAAFQGVAAAQAKVCEFSREGRGVPRNDEEAFKWCRKAAEQGHVVSQLRLAEMYRGGIGVERNPKEARKWEDKAGPQKTPSHESADQQLSAVSR